MTDGVRATDAIPGGMATLNRPAPVDTAANPRIAELSRETADQDLQASPEAADSAVPELEALMVELNRALNVFDIEATYYVDEKTSLKVIQIRDAENHELIRQVPTQQFLDHAGILHELVGLLFDERA